MNFEGPSGQEAVPESVRRSPTLQSSPFRSRAPLPPEGMCAQAEHRRGPDHRMAPLRVEVNEMDVEDAESTVDCARQNGHCPHGEITGEKGTDPGGNQRVGASLAWSRRCR